MIAYGNKKVKKAHLEGTVFLKTGDSEDLNEPDDKYDGAMVAFGVRNFENLGKGLEELRRVLKPGAPLFVLEFSKPTIFPVKQVFNTYFRFVVPFLGKVISKDNEAYTYLYDSVQAFPDYDEMQAVLEKAGFKECEWEALSFGICCLYKAVK
jgi:demethylmenaquinone methyltransferase/2-methoxy-6-polyprenyl-1,4-benzoquinol methylase